ncbi:MAG: hypothetical protein JW973_07565 [Bacteroidales bacterium]|nr:hypothetical protein [Bacteroidales bacterium]
MNSILLCCLIGFFFSVPQGGFKEAQQRNERVRSAYNEKYDAFLHILDAKNININNLEIFLRIYKSEGVLELWGKEKQENAFSLLKEYPVCRSSGHAGPKRRQGDCQVPEGFYEIVNYNPWSSYYLSLSIDYPNAADKILGDQRQPGGNICIHGDCVTIGCIPLTDNGIKEVYLAAVEAKNNGQRRIYVSIFPCRLEKDSLQSLMKEYNDNKDYCNLWTDMKKEYDYFRQYHRRPSITVQGNGRYRVE